LSFASFAVGTGHETISIGYAEAVVGIVDPNAGFAVAAAERASTGIVESEIIEEGVVDEQGLG
jgi:hypothetical protein